MVRKVNTATGVVDVELDTAAGKLIHVACPEHGRMAESMEQQAYICTGWIAIGDDLADGDVSCGKRLTRAEAEQERQKGFDEVAVKDRRDQREEAAEQERRRQAKFSGQRGE